MCHALCACAGVHNIVRPIQEWLNCKGMIIKYKRAVDTPRKIWVSTRFRDAEPGVYKVIENVCSLFDSKWVLIATRAEFVVQYKRAAKQKKPNLVLGLEHLDDPRDC